ncbi:dihydrofolate reductase [Spongorhabdus nitratireducens]
MKIAMIAAVAENNAIGINNKMPWYLPGDLRYFKAVTMGKPIIMGRNTFESLKKPLPGRTNIVITRNPDYSHDGIRVVHNTEEALSLAEDIALVNGNEEIMVIGGGQIYKELLPKADRLYLTKVAHSFEADAYFPEFDESEWTEVARDDHQTDDEPALKYSYIVLDRA